MRIAAIRFINSLPLLYGLEQSRTNDIVKDTPSGCYRRLLEGSVDVALVPVFGTQVDTGVRAIKGLGIAAVSRTESVYLFSRKPLEQVQTVATDPASLTSAALVRIILAMKYGNGTCRLSNSDAGANIHETLRGADAALVIGDEAILTEKTDYDHYDLATEWYSLTRLPFVFAVWACLRPLTAGQVEELKDSYLSGASNLDAVCEQAKTMLPVGDAFLHRYYTQNLHYQLGKPDYEGLLKFLTLASEFGIVPRIRKDIWA